MNPFHPAAAAFSQPTAHTAESLSAAVAAKSEQIAAAHKQDASGGGPQNQIPGSQVNLHFRYIFFVHLLLFKLNAYIIHPYSSLWNNFNEYSNIGTRIKLI